MQIKAERADAANHSQKHACAATLWRNKQIDNQNQDSASY
jgi:hypothetical protein